MKKNICLYSVLVFMLLSCKTVPVKPESADLCGVVIDEKNQPVEDFVVCVKGVDAVTKYGITDSKGMFVIDDLKTGNLELSGYKNGYARYENYEYKFYKRANVFCLQVNSADAILDKVEKLIKNRELKKAEEELSEIYCHQNRILKSVIREYKKIIEELKNEKNDI